MKEKAERIMLDIEAQSPAWPLSFIDAIRTVTDQRGMHWSTMQNLGGRFLKYSLVAKNDPRRGKSGERLYFPMHLVPIEIIAQELTSDEIAKGLSNREIKKKIISLLNENGVEIPKLRGSNAGNYR